MNRRASLDGNGVTSALAGGSAKAQQPPPRFVESGHGARLDWTVLHGLSAWVIDPTWFVRDDGGRTIRVADEQTVEIRGRFVATNIPAKFRIKLALEDGQWMLQIRYADSELEYIPLSDWLGEKRIGINVPSVIRMPQDSAAVVLSGALKGFLAHPLKLELSPASGTTLDFRFNAPSRRALGISRGAAGVVLVSPYMTEGTVARPPIGDDLHKLLDPGAQRKLRVTLDSLTLTEPAGGWSLGQLHESTLRLIPTRPRIIVEAITGDAGGGVAASYAADGIAELRVGKAERPRSIALEQFCYTEITKLRYAMSAQLAASPAIVQSLRYVASVSGRKVTFHPKFCGQPRGKRRMAFPVVLQSLHVRGQDQARYDIDFRRYVDGGQFLDRSHIVWEQRRVEGVDAELTIGEPFPPDEAGAANRLHIDANGSVDVALHRPGSATITADQPILRVRRAEDGLDLGFLFRGYRLVVSAENTVLKREAASQRGVRFHPQHLQEEVFTRSVSLAEAAWVGTKRACVGLLGYASKEDKEDEAGLRRLGDSAEYDTGRFTRLARTRVSGASRVIFAAEIGAGNIPLEVAALTKWDGLPLAIPLRAGLVTLPLNEQIKRIGIDVGMQRDPARAQVAGSLVPPTPAETSLELVTGLHFAPGHGARLRVPKSARDRLWTARLDLTALPATTGAPDIAVCAVWATGFKPDAFFANGCGTDAADGPEAPFRTSLSARERSEIMLQSSAVGIAALRSLTLTGIDVPSSHVRIPREPSDTMPVPFNYVLKERRVIPGTHDEVQQEGVAAPAVFARFNARLTAFGADLDAEWKGESIAPFDARPIPPSTVKPVFFDHALSVEKYTHRTSLGSDVSVEVLYKGFLLPYGFWVSVIKVTAREPWFDEAFGAMMPAGQRFFIKPGSREKTFPGIYQPFSGKQFPARSARLDFDLSPELDPDVIKKPPPGFTMPVLLNSEKPGCVPKNWKKPPGRIFWPTLKGTSDDILFDLVADGTNARRSMPMLFIDNAVSHHPEAMKALHRYYNGVEASRRTEQHYGERTMYAPATKAGDTSFETKHNILTLTNRTAAEPTAPTLDGKPDADLSSYQIDAFMSGAYELPLYPALEEALIRIAALDRLVGKPQGFKRVAYVQHYLEHGFDQAANAGELYLEFIDAEKMDLGGQSIAGGFAQMRSNFAGISRGNAIVGAPRNYARGITGKTERWNFKDVVSDSFNPASFFEGATLLGVVKFEDVIQLGKMADQPKLREVFEYTAGADTAFKPIREACTAAAGATEVALDKAEAALVAFITAEPISGWEVVTGGRWPNIARCYPDLTQGLGALITALEKAKDGYVLEAAAEITDAWRNVKGAVDSVVANPAPEPLRGVVGSIRAIVDGLRGQLGEALQKGVADPLKAFIEGQVYRLLDAVVDQCFDAATGELLDLILFDAFFGGLRPKLPQPPPDPPVPPTANELKEFSRGLFANPQTIAEEIRTSPVGEAITVPLLRLVADLRQIQTKIVGAEAEFVATQTHTARTALESVLAAAASIHLLIEASKAAAQDLCKDAAAPLSQLVQLAVDALPSDAEIAHAFKVVVAQYRALDLPDLEPSPQVTPVRLAAANLRGAIQDASDRVVEVSRLRGAFAQAIPLWCTKPGWLARAVADLVNSRAATLRAFANCTVQAKRLAAALDALADAEVKNARDALLVVRRELVFLAYRWTLAMLAEAAQHMQSELERRAAPLAAPIRARLAELETALRADAVSLAKRYREYPQDPLSANLDELFVEFVEQSRTLTELERRWLALATDITAIPGKIATELATIPAKLAQTLAEPLVTLHRKVLGFADEALAQLANTPDFVLMLTRTAHERLALARHAVATDLAELDAIAADPSLAGALVNRWRGGGDIRLVVAARTVVELFTAAARGQIGAIFNLDDVKGVCEDAVRRFIPSRVMVLYDWTPELKGNSVFLPGENASGGKALVELDEDGNPFKPLVITTRIDVDLLDPDKRSVSIEGKMQPFAVKLLGSMDLVTVGFTNTRFLSVNGGAPKFSTSIADFQIGESLEFIKALQDSLGCGAGFAITPTLEPPGIRISYAFAQDIITFGALTILNLSFEVAATLPLGGSPATFQFAVGSRNQPFGMIIAPCYYGGGFISMTATGSSIGDFEIQLEFGAATAIRFGPLRGQGRVSTGIYFHSVQGGNDELSGFVHAIGEGQVACFGVSIAMAVELHHDNGSGQMVGDALFSFSFRMGFASITYGVTATYKFKGGASGNALGPMGHLTEKKPKRPECEVYKPSSNDPLNKMTDWIGYSTHFVEAWA